MKKGITLIEVLVTALILEIGISAILMSFVHCKRVILNDTHRFNSSLILNEQLEEIVRIENAAEVADYITAWNNRIVTKQISAEKDQDYRLTFRTINVVSPTGTSDISWVTATVTWETYKGTRDMSMSVFTNEPD